MFIVLFDKKNIQLGNESEPFPFFKQYNKILSIFDKKLDKMNSEIAQYYNEVFKQPEDLPFESLPHEDAIRFEKIFKNSFSFIGWKNGKAIDEFKNELNKILSRINMKLRF